MKTTVLWNVAPFSLVEIYRRFGGTNAAMMETANISEKSVN